MNQDLTAKPKNIPKHILSSLEVLRANKLSPCTCRSMEELTGHFSDMDIAVSALENHIEQLQNQIDDLERSKYAGGHSVFCKHYTGGSLTLDHNNIPKVVNGKCTCGYEQYQVSLKERGIES